MNYLFAIIVVLLLLVLVLGIRAIVQHNRKIGRRPAELRQGGSPLGLVLVQPQDPEDATLDRQLLGGTTLGSVVQEMDGGLAEMLHGQVDGMEVWLGEMFESRSGGRLPSDYHTVLVVIPAAGGLPRFYLQPTRSSTRPGKIPGCVEPERFVRVKLEDGRFDLDVYEPHRERVEDVLRSQAVRGFLVGWEPFVESLQDRLLIRAADHVVAAPEIAEHVRRGVWLAGLLREQTPYR